MNRATGTKLKKINTNGSPKKQNVSDLKKKKRSSTSDALEGWLKMNVFWSQLRNRAKCCEQSFLRKKSSVPGCITLANNKDKNQN